MLFGPTATADPSESYVSAASGKVADNRWELRIGREHGRRCYKLSLAARYVGVAVVCETESKPPRLWSRVVGNASDTAAVELEITAPRVSRLRLLVGHPGADEGHSKWWSGPTRSLSKAETSTAHLTANFRFAVIAGRGPNLCVEKVRAFDREGELLKKLSVPCEY